MNHASGNKSVTKAASSVAASATHSHEIDCAGFKYAAIDVVFSPFTAATTSYASVLKVQESDASGSGQADVSGLSITAGGGSPTCRQHDRCQRRCRGSVQRRPAGPEAVPDGRDEPRQYGGRGDQRSAQQGRAVPRHCH